MGGVQIVSEIFVKRGPVLSQTQRQAGGEMIVWSDPVSQSPGVAEQYITSDILYHWTPFGIRLAILPQFPFQVLFYEGAANFSMARLILTLKKL